MKTLIQILTLATTLAGTAAAAAAQGYINAFPLPDCTEASGVSKQNPYDLDPGKCVQVAAFTSFVAGINAPCPKGKTADVKAYSGQNCDGNAVDAGTLPASHSPSECQETAVKSASGSVSVGGRSAMFKCI